MSWPSASFGKLREVAWWEYVVRFVFGGLVTVAAGLVAKHGGLALGGMCLAFPAILPASLTLVSLHEGRERALEDARGGRVGALALAWFAVVVLSTATRWPFGAVLAVATLAWLAVAVAAWRVWLAD